MNIINRYFQNISLFHMSVTLQLILNSDFDAKYLDCYLAHKLTLNPFTGKWLEINLENGH